VRWLKIALVVLLVYVGIVVVFETLLGIFQPAGAGTLVITTKDEQGQPHDRVLSRLDSDGKVYASANHWPRAWFEQARKNPEVELTIDGQRGAYLAVPVSGAEHDRLMAEHPHGFVFRFVTGFPPRYFIRFDPR
jgi:hypothetical protein